MSSMPCVYATYRAKGRHAHLGPLNPAVRLLGIRDGCPYFATQNEPARCNKHALLETFHVSVPTGVMSGLLVHENTPSRSAP